MIIDENLIVQETESVDLQSFAVVESDDFDILNSSMIGFGITGIMCLIGLGIGAILYMIRKSM